MTIEEKLVELVASANEKPFIRHTQSGIEIEQCRLNTQNGTLMVSLSTSVAIGVNVMAGKSDDGRIIIDHLVRVAKDCDYHVMWLRWKKDRHPTFNPESGEIRDFLGI